MSLLGCIAAPLLLAHYYRYKSNFEWFRNYIFPIHESGIVQNLIPERFFVFELHIWNFRIYTNPVGILFGRTLEIEPYSEQIQAISFMGH